MQPKITSIALFTLCLIGGFLAACDTVYVLPDPPPVQERRSVSLIPGEDERLRERDYLQARAAVLKAYQLLSSKRYKASLDLMSQETRDFLKFASPTKDAQSPEIVTLSQGKFVLQNGRTISFDPPAWLLAKDVSKLKDTIKGQKEQETSRRKEIYAVQPDGKWRKIVVIKEAGTWVIHRTSISLK